MNLPQNKEFAKWLSLFSIFLILVAMLLATTQVKNVQQTRSQAQGIVPDCTKDTNSLDYCGDTAPFRGCVGGVGGNEWLCMCRLKSGKWWSECSIIEDAANKQKWIDKCGGDKEKAFMQWRYDIAIIETGDECSCGGQNVCGSLVPVRPTRIPGDGGGVGGGVVEPTNIIFPTSAPRELPTQQPMPTVPINNQASPLTNSLTLPRLSFPEFRLPALQFHPDLSGVNRLVSGPLDLLESLFNRIIYYDSQLERYINMLFHR